MINEHGNIDINIMVGSKVRCVAEMVVRFAFL